MLAAMAVCGDGGCGCTVGSWVGKRGHGMLGVAWLPGASVSALHRQPVRGAATRDNSTTSSYMALA